MGTKHPDVFAALAAPFGKAEVKERPGQGGVMLKYITARTAMNRLDEVIGPENWQCEFMETEKGIKCRLMLRIENQWIPKEDGAGFASMKDASDTEKSGFSEAFKRVCVMWGIGRYLYRDGMPPYVREALGLTEGKIPAANGR